MTVAVSITLKRYLRLRTTRRTAKLRQSWKRNVMTQRSKTRARRKKSRWLCWQIIFVEQETIQLCWSTSNLEIQSYCGLFLTGIYLRRIPTRRHAHDNNRRASGGNL